MLSVITWLSEIISNFWIKMSRSILLQNEVSHSNKSYLKKSLMSSTDLWSKTQQLTQWTIISLFNYQLSQTCLMWLLNHWSKHRLMRSLKLKVNWLIFDQILILNNFKETIKKWSCESIRNINKYLTWFRNLKSRELTTSFHRLID